MDYVFWQVGSVWNVEFKHPRGWTETRAFPSRGRVIEFIQDQLDELDPIEGLEHVGSGITKCCGCCNTRYPVYMSAKGDYYFDCPNHGRFYL